MVKIRALKRLAERGDVEAMAALGVDYSDVKNFEESTRWFLKAAEKGSSDAQLMLGAKYDNGQGVEIDKVEAVRWYRLAAEQGNSTAMHALAANYMIGEGVTKDIPQGIQWYRKAAEQGDRSSQILLGGLYANSEFLPKDNVEAVFWYSAAFKASALTRSVAKEYEEELRWFLSVAEVGDSDVLLNVANIYSSRGGGVPQDNVEAMRCYHLAAEKGNEEALCFIGKMYESGQGVPQDFAEAMQWYLRAAERGNAGAIFNVGMMYNRSQGVSIDSRELYFWFCLCSTCPLPQEQASHAQRAIEVLTTKLSPESIAEIKQRAQQWIGTHPKIHFR